MKVKIGNRIIDSNDQPVMIIFDEGEKELISNMSDDHLKLCLFPEDGDVSEIERFMEDDEDTNQLNMSVDHDVVIINPVKVGD